MNEAERPTAEPSDVEGGGTDQTWGQGEGRHEPTIPEDEDEQPAATYSGGSAATLDDPDLPLTREDEDMDR